MYVYSVLYTDEVGPRNSKSLINHQRMWHNPVAAATVFIHDYTYIYVYKYMYIYYYTRASCPRADGFQLTGSTWNIRPGFSDYIIVITIIVIILCAASYDCLFFYFFFFLFSKYFYTERVQRVHTGCLLRTRDGPPCVCAWNIILLP